MVSSTCTSSLSSGPKVKWCISRLLTQYCCITNHFKTQWRPTISIYFFHSRVCALVKAALLQAEGSWGWLQTRDSEWLQVTPYSPWESSCRRHILPMENQRSTREHENTWPLKALALLFTSHWFNQAPWPSPRPVRQGSRFCNSVYRAVARQRESAMFRVYQKLKGRRNYLSPGATEKA